MHKLSVVIITYNEENTIADCIQSIAGIADEVLVLDSYSVDQTTVIAEKLGAIVKKHRFDGHIQQKNRAKNMAANQWVLSLDADERATPEMCQAIVQILTKPEHDGYFFNRRNHYKGKWIKGCGWYPDSKLRLWKKDFGSWVGKNPHDRFELNSNLTSAQSNTDMLHFTYASFDALKKQSHKFAKIGAQSNAQYNLLYLIGKLVSSPLLKFIKSYLVRGGIGYGKDGFIISYYQMRETFFKYWWAIFKH